MANKSVLVTRYKYRLNGDAHTTSVRCFVISRTQRVSVLTIKPWNELIIWNSHRAIYSTKMWLLGLGKYLKILKSGEYSRGSLQPGLQGPSVLAKFQRRTCPGQSSTRQRVQQGGTLL